MYHTHTTATQIRSRICARRPATRPTDDDRSCADRPFVPPVPAEPTLHFPEFDSQSLRYVYNIDRNTWAVWQADLAARTMKLDTVLVCPRCECLPSFRPGCPQCGSAFFSRTSLLHHFSCAHIAEEQDFADAGELTCPKCLRQHLVVGADLEHLPGRHTCHDCQHTFTDSMFVGHCLNCQHRFAAAEAQQIELIAWQIPERPAAATEATACAAASSDSGDQC